MKLCFVAVSSFLPIVSIYATASLIDGAVSFAQGTGSVSGVTAPLSIFLAYVAYEKLENAVTQITKIRVRLRLFETFRLAIIDRRSRLDYALVENSDAYDLVRRVSDAPENKALDTFETMAWLASMAMNIACLLIMLFASVGWPALIVIAAAVPVQFIAMKNGRRFYAGFKESEKAMRRADYLSDILSQRDAADERAMFGFSGKMGERFLAFYKQAYRIMEKTFREISGRKMASDALILLVSLGITAELLVSALNGALSVAMFVSLTGVVFSVVQYTSERLPRQIRNLTEKAEYFRDLTAFAALETAEGAECLPKRPAPKLESVVLRGVAFAYPGGGHDVLKGVSLAIEPGKRYAIVGANGAGKSTLVKLLAGLYPKYRGEILINGRELRSIPPDELKAFFSIVHQDFARYAVSLEDNIALGAGLGLDAARPDISRAAGLVNIGEIAGGLPGGMAAVIGKEVPGGQDISGGQWQRVAMARALARDAPLVILDEPTAALDPIGESGVYQHFEEISRNRTTVLISHRLGSTKLADEIIVLDGGAVAELGSHEALMARGGIYAEMYEAQRSWYQ
jgi:ATP-binding cassette subfamily B protein